jgi:hypothetical protein
LWLLFREKAAGASLQVEQPKQLQSPVCEIAVAHRGCIRYSALEAIFLDNQGGTAEMFSVPFGMEIFIF